jgi:TonB family protein
MRVSTEGVPEQVVITSSTNPGFNEASLRVIRSVRFRPAAVNGRPVAVPVELPLQWEPWPASSGRNPLR